jgi:hypothetical protein
VRRIRFNWLPSAIKELVELKQIQLEALAALTARPALTYNFYAGYAEIARRIAAG